MRHAVSFRKGAARRWIGLEDALTSRFRSTKKGNFQKTLATMTRCRKVPRGEPRKRNTERSPPRLTTLILFCLLRLDLRHAPAAVDGRAATSRRNVRYVLTKAPKVPRGELVTASRIHLSKISITPTPANVGLRMLWWMRDCLGKMRRWASLHQHEAFRLVKAPQKRLLTSPIKQFRKEG